VSVSKDGTGNGTVSSSPAGIDCGPTCSASFSGGTQVTLTATGSTIDNRCEGWSGVCSGTGNCSITVSGDASVTATFDYCAASYPTVCIPPPPPDLDCGDISYRNFTVLWNVPDPDPHHFDGDHDGIGCET
jgi:Divergent InlB B-repeat domain